MSAATVYVLRRAGDACGSPDHGFYGFVLLFFVFGSDRTLERLASTCFNGVQLVDPLYFFDLLREGDMNGKRDCTLIRTWDRKVKAAILAGGVLGNSVKDCSLFFVHACSMVDRERNTTGCNVHMKLNRLNVASDCKCDA